MGIPRIGAHGSDAVGIVDSADGTVGSSVVGLVSE